MQGEPWYHEHLPWELKLDRDYHLKSAQILDWLRTHMGDGVINGYIPTEQIPNMRWSWYQVFGHTFLRFKNQEDLLKFRLSWC